MPGQEKHFDVARPGTVSPQHTSRPIIVSREPLIQDPMMNPKQQPVESMASRGTELAIHHETTVTPPSGSHNAEQGESPLAISHSDTAASNHKDYNAEISKPDILESPVRKNTQHTQEAVTNLIESKEYQLSIKRPTAATGKIIILLVAVIVTSVVIYIALRSANII